MKKQNKEKGMNKKLSNKESLQAWENNAEFWDQQMGDESNEFHQITVRPMVHALLNPLPNDYVLDIACGNGNYAAYLAQKKIHVTAFDYSLKMIELAKKRQKKYKEYIDFFVADATNEESLMKLKKKRLYTKAVSNMAIMDISDLSVLFRCVNRLLVDDGIFVFATQHPCFVTLTEKYMTPHDYYGEAIMGQPVKHCYYHRSLQDIFHICFQNGFIIDEFKESCFRNKEKPEIIIVRIRKAKSI